MSEGAGDGGSIAGADEAQDAIVVGWAEAFHGAGIDAECGCGGHEIAERDIRLFGGPMLDLVAACPFDEVADHHVAVTFEGFDRRATDLCGALDEGINIGAGERGSRGEYDVVRGIYDLALIPGVRQEFGAFCWGVDDQETVGLKAEGRGGEHERLQQSAPEFGGDFAGGVEGLGGIAPVERLEQLGGRNRVHFDFDAEWLLPVGGAFPDGFALLNAEDFGAEQ